MTFLRQILRTILRLMKARLTMCVTWKRFSDRANYFRKFVWATCSGLSDHDRACWRTCTVLYTYRYTHTTCMQWSEKTGVVHFVSFGLQSTVMSETLIQACLTVPHRGHNLASEYSDSRTSLLRLPKLKEHPSWDHMYCFSLMYCSIVPKNSGLLLQCNRVFFPDLVWPEQASTTGAGTTSSHTEEMDENGSLKMQLLASSVTRGPASCSEYSIKLSWHILCLSCVFSLKASALSQHQRAMDKLAEIKDLLRQHPKQVCFVSLSMVEYFELHSADSTTFTCYVCLSVSVIECWWEFGRLEIPHRQNLFPSGATCCVYIACLRRCEPICWHEQDLCCTLPFLIPRHTQQFSWHTIWEWHATSSSTLHQLQRGWSKSGQCMHVEHTHWCAHYWLISDVFPSINPCFAELRVSESVMYSTFFLV